jgi:ribosomal protein S27AE
VTGLPPRWEDVRRELARARAARRAGPFLLGSTLAAGLLVAVAARSPPAGLAMLVPGALLWLVLRGTATPRCPACGESLWTRDDRPGRPSAPRETRVERERRCPRCGANLAG